MSKKLIKAIADMREGEALKLAKEMVAGGSDPIEILKAARQAMDIVGQRYQEGTYFLPDEAIKTAGLRDGVKIMIGGGQVNEKIREYPGADAYGGDAMEAVNLARKWIGGN